MNIKKVSVFLISTIIALIAVFLMADKYFFTSDSKSYFTDDPPKIKSDENNTILKKTVVYSFGGKDYGNFYKEMVSLFQKQNPDIEVKLQQLPNSTDYQWNAYKVALSSGDNSFDVFNADIIWTAEFASSDWLLPIDPYISKNEYDEFIPNTIQTCKYDGKLYGMPHKTDAGMLYYRNDLIDTPPKTYKQLVSLAASLLKSSGIKYGYVFQGKSYECLVCNALEFIWNNGGEVIKDGKVVINSPEAIEGLEIFVDLVNSSITSPDVLNFEEDDSLMAFQDGNAVFMRNWPIAYRQLNMETSKVRGNTSIAPLPLGPKGSISSSTLGGWNYMINKKSKYPDESWRFIRWASSYDMQVIDSISGAAAPPRKAAYGDPEILKSNPWIANFKGIFENAKPRPVSPNYSSISQAMQINFTNALTRKISAKTAIENIESALKVFYPK